MTYYGVIDEIWVLDYHLLKVLMLKYDSVQNCCVMKDKLGFILLDLYGLGCKPDPFILASQAKQIFYVND